MTSVIGILLLVTLLLSLHFTMIATVASASTRPDDRAKELREQLEDLKDEVSRAQKRFEDARKEADQGGADLPTKRRGALADQGSRLRRLHDEIEEVEGRNSGHALAIEETGLAGGKSGGSIDRKSRSQQNVDRLRADLEGVLRNPRLIYMPSAGAAKQPLLVEVSAEAILCGLAEETPQVFSARGSTMDVRVNAALPWISGYSPAKFYVLFLAKPSGIECVRKLQEEVSGRGYEIGLDPLPESKSAFSEVVQGNTP